MLGSGRHSHALSLQSQIINWWIRRIQFVHRLSSFSHQPPEVRAQAADVDNGMMNHGQESDHLFDCDSEFADRCRLARGPKTGYTRHAVR